MKICYTLLLFLVCTLGYSQRGLAGLWKGEMTLGGLNSAQKVKFEIFLEVKGKRIKGRSYVHLDNEKTIEMDIKGRMFDDRSLYLHEIEFIPTTDTTLQAPFNRKYQLIYNRSFDSTLDGYWQEIITSPFDDKRERGRIKLRKVPESKA